MYLKLTRFFVSLGGALLWLTGCGAEDSSGGEWSRSAAEAFVSTYASSGNFSGAVLVARDGKTLLESAYGRADYELDAPIDPRTRFRIASITKSFTAAAVSLLADRGSVALDAPLARYITGFPHGERITVRNLLAHESGLPNYYYDLEDYPALSRQHYDSPADVIALVSGMPLRFGPGARRAYNNLNYTGLAWLIEDVSGTDYESFLRQELLSPLGIQETGYDSDVQALVPDLAKGYDPVGVSDFRKSRYFDHSISVGAGSMYSTARDLARWAEMLIGGTLLQSPSLDAAIEYGWSKHEIHGREAVTAEGWDNVGYSAHVIHLPADGLTVVVLSNLNIARVVGEIAEGLVALALGEVPAGMPLAPGALPEDSLSTLTGRYQFGDDFYSPGGLLEIVVRDGMLFDVSRDPEASLIPLADGGFLYRPVWARVAFLTGDDGNVAALRFYDQFVAQRLAAPQ
jgi:CubicO group peptidase (beta-lactamase class C family)